MTLGPYGKAAADYVDHGKVVFPVRAKRPAIYAPQKVTLQRSLDLIPKFEDANLGIWCGPKNGLTIVDIDAPGEQPIADAVRQFGETPIKVRTASDKHHLWYRHNGERRKIRPFAGVEIDLLGDNGFAVGPPSEVVGKGAYSFIEGGLDDLDRLPVILSGSLPEDAYGRRQPQQPTNDNQAAADGKIPPGRREPALFAEARRLAKWYADFDVYLNELRGWNEEECDPPLPEEEVIEKAHHVWKMKADGECFAPGGGETYATITSDEAAQLRAHPLAFVLLHFLRANHAQDHEFAVSPRGLAKVLPQSSPTIRIARDVLWIHRGFLILTHRGGREDGDAHKFRFSTPAERTRIQAGGVGKEF